MTVQIQRRPFTADEYHKMAQAGILCQDDRVELLDGEIVEMVPIGPSHAACVDRLNQILSRRLGERAIVRVQNPIRLGERSEPQPDLALLAPRPDFYAAAHPTPEDVLLVVEVAENSAELDRQVKVPLYARAGVREVWLVDLTARLLEVCREPSPQGYLRAQQLRPGQRVAPLALGDVEIAAGEILG